MMKFLSGIIIGLLVGYFIAPNQKTSEMEHQVSIQKKMPEKSESEEYFPKTKKKVRQNFKQETKKISKTNASKTTQSMSADIDYTPERMYQASLALKFDELDRDELWDTFRDEEKEDLSLLVDLAAEEGEEAVFETLEMLKATKGESYVEQLQIQMEILGAKRVD